CDRGWAPAWAPSVPELDGLLRRHELADVGAGRERLLTRAGHHDRPRLAALRELREAGSQLLAHTLVHRVVHARAVQRDRRDRVGQLVANRLVRPRSGAPRSLALGS